MSNVRGDPLTGTIVHVVGTRQERPNLPADACPFCVGGLDAPERYDVRWFLNRWPAMEGERCEVVLYTPDHDSTFAALDTDEARRVVDLWAERTAALGARDDVAYVLVFENRGAEVGATIAHPHGQIYAYDHVPRRQTARLDARWAPDRQPDERTIATANGWSAWVPYAPTFPVSIEIAPLHRVADLPTMSNDDRDAFAALLVDVLARLDRMYDTPLPYMMWLNQRPSAGEWSDAWFNVEIVSPWRAAGVPRYIAAAEIASEEYFNPVVPEELADRLRRLS